MQANVLCKSISVSIWRKLIIINIEEKKSVRLFWYLKKTIEQEEIYTHTEKIQ